MPRVQETLWKAGVPVCRGSQPGASVCGGRQSLAIPIFTARLFPITYTQWVSAFSATIPTRPASLWSVPCSAAAAARCEGCVPAARSRSRAARAPSRIACCRLVILTCSFARFRSGHSARYASRPRVLVFGYFPARATARTKASPCPLRRAMLLTWAGVSPEAGRLLPHRVHSTASPTTVQAWWGRQCFQAARFFSGWGFARPLGLGSKSPSCQ